MLAIFRPGAPALLDVRTREEAAARVQGAEAALGQARVTAERAHSESAFAASELTRYQQLLKVGGATEQQLASAELDARTKDAQVRAAELAARVAAADLEAARAALRRSTVPASSSSTGADIVLRSPVDGVVLKRHHESEAPVAAGEPLIEVGDPAKLEVVADLLSTDAVKVQAGDPVEIDRWGGEGSLKGEVRLVEPSGFTKISALGVEEQRVNVIVDLRDPRPSGQQLGDAFRVEVRVIIWEQANVLRAPMSALFRSGDGWAAYVARDGRAVRVAVGIGQRNSTYAEVMSGLSEGDQVIVYPGEGVDDGVAVTKRTAA